ncbi:MAG: ASCH domain-containing protein [Bacilli bacterium]|nr:ASCH domain-containing protein [Bacilli bacterium]
MKALTIKEPWASLIVQGFKKFEFRSWKTNYRGKVLIHAGLSKENIEKYKDYNLDISSGEIIGEAYIADCILVDEKLDKSLRKIDEKVYGNNHVGLYAFKLENVKKYNKKIKVKGNLGLWNYKNKIQED